MGRFRTAKGLGLPKNRTVMKILRCRASAATLYLALLLAAATQAQPAGQAALAAAKAMEYGYFDRHLRYLASNELKGRATGTAGYDTAASYLAEAFRQNGLLPFGDAGTYFQKVPLLKCSIQPSTFKLQVTNKSASVTAGYGSDISVVLNPERERIDERQGMVFVGYGNVLPDADINDYEGVDVKGKTVIVALGGPKGMAHPAFDDRNAKFANAVAHGATGLILFYPKASLLQRTIFKRVHGFLSGEMLALADTLAESSIVRKELNLLLFAKKGFVKKVLVLNGLSLKQQLRSMAEGKHVSSPLESAIDCSYALRTETIASSNVVGLLPGRQGGLEGEYIVFGAHLDGLGVGKAIRGDSIYNGMLDNASGAAALLSVSKAFNALPQRPKRSIIFVGYTAEERGLLGSAYFASRNRVYRRRSSLVSKVTSCRHKLVRRVCALCPNLSVPSLTNGEIVANINIDMLAQTIETADMAPLGYAHSNLSEAADFAARALSLKIDDNKAAERKYIERSDQVAFLKKGIPALFIAGGFTALKPGQDGKKVFERWMDKRYHSPFDDLNQAYSEAAFLTAARFNFLTAYYMANSMEAVRWNTDSWLYRKYVLEAE